MATLTTGKTWVNAETITATKLNNTVNAATITDIVNADIKSDAAIVDTKLAQITTANKVSITALTGLTGTISLIIDGGGATITTGIKADLEIPFACTLTQYTLLADQSGAIKIDIWKDTYANYPPTNDDSICDGKEPEIAASGTKAQDTDISDWTTVAVTAGNTLRFNVDSCTSITRALLSLKYTRG